MPQNAPAGWAPAPEPREPGLLTPGNIDLTNRPRVKNPDGTTSTVRSMSFGDNGREVLIPTVSDDGRVLSNADAITAYRTSGKHLGIFDTPANATAYAQRVHQQQAQQLTATPAGWAPAPEPGAEAGGSVQLLGRATKPAGIGPPSPRTKPLPFDATKPTHIGGPPTFGETMRRSLPEVFGALGMALGSEAGPAGVGVGAYIGGHTGKGIQQGIRAAGYGPPPPPTIAGQEAERSNAGTGQAANAAVGEGLGAVVPGGVLHPPVAAGRAVEANTAEGLGLSLPEVLKGTKLGTALEGVNQLAERSTVGRLAATSARARWTPAIRKAYAEGKVTLQDIGAAKGELEKGAGVVDNRPMKAAAQRLIDEEITPRTEHYGGTAAPPPATPVGRPAAGTLGAPPSARRDPAQWDLSRLSPEDRAAVLGSTKQKAPKGADRVTQELYNTVNSPDEVPFKAAALQRTKFWDLSRAPDVFQTKAQGQATAMHGAFTQTMEGVNPAWGDLTHTYHDLRQQIGQPFVKQIIRKDPEAWAGAIERAKASKPYKELTGDQEGQRAIQRLKNIGAAASRRDASLPSRGWMPVLEALAAGSGHLPSLVGTEALSGLYTFAMYHPAVAQYLIHGFKAPNAQLAGAAFTQAVQAWRAGQDSEAETTPAAKAGGPPAPKASTRPTSGPPTP